MAYYGSLHHYWLAPPSQLPTLILPPSCHTPYLHDLHESTTGTSISLNRPRHHLHPQYAPTILNMMKYQNGIDQQVKMVNNRKRKRDTQ